MNLNRLTAATFGLGLGLRIWTFWVGLSEKYWYDEAYTWLLAHRPLPDLLAGTAADVHPPLWYLLVRFMPVGQPIEWARLLPLAFSLAALPMYWLILRQTALSPRGRLLALALMALSPVQIWYANELRMYSLLILLVLVQWWAVTNRRWVILGLSTLLTLYTQNFGLVYSLAMGLIALVNALKTPRARYEAGQGEFSNTDIPAVFISFGIPLVFYAPWAFVLPAQLDKVSNGNYWLQPITLGQAFAALSQVMVGLNLRGIAAPLLFIVFCASFVLVVFYAVQNKRAALITWGLFPWLFAITVSLIWAPMMHYRSFLASVPALYILYAHALDQAARPWKYTGLAILAATLAVSLTMSTGEAQTRISKTHFDALPTTYQYPIVHIEDTTLITWLGQGIPNNYFIQTDCPEQLSALKPKVRAALGVNLITLDQLPEHYTLVTMVSGLSSKCQEDVFNQLATNQTRLSGWDESGYTWGIYDVTH